MDEPLDPRTPFTPAAMSRGARWGVAAGLLGALVVAYWLRYVLLPFVAAGALVYLARPLLHWLQRRLGFPRWLAALVPFLLLLGVLAGIAFVAYSTILPQVLQMANNAPRMIELFVENIFRNVLHQDRITLMGRTYDAQAAAAALLDSMRAGDGGTGAITALSTGIGIIMGFILTVVLFGFFLFSGPALTRGVLWLIPPRLRPRARALAAELDPMLARYLRGVFVIVLYATGATWVVTGLIFRLPHAILLALAVGLLELIPVIGPILSFMAFGLVAVEQKSFGAILGFGIFAIMLRLSIDQLVGPLVLGRAARIPAVVVIFSFLAGGALYGLLGVVLAIPFAATVKIVLSHLYDRPDLPDAP